MKFSRVMADNEIKSKSNDSPFYGFKQMIDNSINYLGKTVRNITTVSPLVSAIGALVGTICTIVAAAFSVGTLGCSKRMNKLADAFEIKPSKFILTNVYVYVLRIVNPEALFFREERPRPEDDTWISSMFALPIFNKAKDASSKSNILSRHFVSRGCYAIAGLVSIITKAADLALGVLAAVYSFTPYFGKCGRVERYNSFAFDQLGALSLVDDLCHAARGVINPQQFLGETLPSKIKVD